MNSNAKGKRGERELANKLKNLGILNARRSQQYNGVSGDADLLGLKGIHIECKRVEALNINKAMEQAETDCKNVGLPTVFHRKNGKPWLVTMDLYDWMKLYDKYVETQ